MKKYVQIEFGFVIPFPSREISLLCVGYPEISQPGPGLRGKANTARKYEYGERTFEAGHVVELEILVVVVNALLHAGALNNRIVLSDKVRPENMLEKALRQLSRLHSLARLIRRPANCSTWHSRNNSGLDSLEESHKSFSAVQDPRTLHKAVHIPQFSIVGRSSRL